MIMKVNRDKFLLEIFKFSCHFAYNCLLLSQLPPDKSLGHWVFSNPGHGVSADPDKIQHIIQVSRPDTVEDVRSLLQAAAYNARIAFEHRGN